MSTDPTLSAIKALHREHMRKLLQTCIDGNQSNDICDYYENMCAEQPQKQLRKKKPNLHNTPESKNIFINDDLFKCHFCHSPLIKKRNSELNFSVIVKARPRITTRSAAIYSRYKRLVLKYRYKSYRSRLIKQIENKSIKLVYQCKKCQSKNLVFKELRRLTPLSLIQPRQSKVQKKASQSTLKNEATTKPVLSNKSSQYNQSVFKIPSSLNSNISQNNVSTSKISKPKNKKFQNLKLKLEAEMREQKEKATQNFSTTTSLLDFLQRV